MVSSMSTTLGLTRPVLNSPERGGFLVGAWFETPADMPRPPFDSLACLPPSEGDPSHHVQTIGNYRIIAFDLVLYFQPLDGGPG